MKRTLTFVAALATFLVLAGIALANSASISDPKGDVKHNPPGNVSTYDIVKATFGHAKHGKLAHTVRVAGKISDPGASGVPQPTMLINVPGKHVSDLCDYWIGPPDWSVHKCLTSQRTGSAQVTRTDSHTDRFVFPRKAIGSPDRYSWAFGYVLGCGGGGCELADRAPNSGFKVHRRL